MIVAANDRAHRANVVDEACWASTSRSASSNTQRLGAMLSDPADPLGNNRGTACRAAATARCTRAPRRCCTTSNSRSASRRWNARSSCTTRAGSSAIPRIADFREALAEGTGQRALVERCSPSTSTTRARSTTASPSSTARRACRRRAWSSSRARWSNASRRTSTRPSKTCAPRGRRRIRRRRTARVPFQYATRDHRPPRRRSRAANGARALRRRHVAHAAPARHRRTLGALAPGDEEPRGVGRTRSGTPRLPRQGQDRRQPHARSRRYARRAAGPADSPRSSSPLYALLVTHEHERSQVGRIRRPDRRPRPRVPMAPAGAVGRWACCCPTLVAMLPISMALTGARITRCTRRRSRIALRPRNGCSKSFEPLVKQQGAALNAAGLWAS